MHINEFIKELEDCFGKFDEAEKSWAFDNLNRLDEESKKKFFSLLKDKHEKKNEPLSIYEMGEILEKVSGKKARTYFWSVCMECGAEYAYGLPMCPACYRRGLSCRTYAVKKSEFPPPAKVFRFNKEYFEQGERSCYDCPDTELSYCSNFGNEKYDCNDLRNCKCAACCVKLKHENQKLMKGSQEVKTSYAVPLNQTKVG